MKDFKNILASDRFLESFRKLDDKERGVLLRVLANINENGFDVPEFVFPSEEGNEVLNLEGDCWKISFQEDEHKYLLLIKLEQDKYFMISLEMN